MPNELLNPQRFKDKIAKNDEYLDELPKRNIDEMSPELFHKKRANAIRLGSLAIADDLMERHGEYNLDANLFELVGTITPFLTANQAVDTYQDHYGHLPDYKIPDFAKEQFRQKKQDIIAFNHTLKEVINVGAGKFNFNELLVFMTNMNTVINGKRTQEYFYNAARDRLVGMRNEVAVEQILIAAGIEYQTGSVVEDARGGDFIIHNELYDVKSSELEAIKARREAIRNGHDPAHIIFSGIKFEEYGGRLVLPAAVVAKKVPVLTAALASGTPSAAHLSQRA